MKTGIVQSAYMNRYGVEKGLAKMREHGFSCLDYSGLQNVSDPLYSLNDRDFEQTLSALRKQIESAGIYVSQIHGPWSWPPDDTTEEKREIHRKYAERSIFGAACIGSENFVIHPVFPWGCDQDPDPEKMWQINRDFLVSLLPAAEKYGVTVCFENMPMTVLAISGPAAILKMVKEINNPRLKVCLDTGHSNILGCPPADAVRMLGKEFLAVLHVHDNNGLWDQHLLPGEGTTDWDDFAAALKEIGFEGTVSLETTVPAAIEIGPERDVLELKLAKTAQKLAGIL